MSNKPRFDRSLVTALVAAMLIAVAPLSASAISLADLVDGATITSGDGSLTFSDFDVTLPDVVDGRSNTLAGINLDIFQVEVFEQSFGFQVFELDGPISAANGGIGQMILSFDVDAAAGFQITSVGLDFVGAAAGPGAFASVTETVTGATAGADLFVIREFAGAQIPSDFAELEEGQQSLGVEKNILVDSANGPLAQISEIEQTFGVSGSAVPEPSSALLFAAGALIVATRAKRKN